MTTVHLFPPVPFYVSTAEHHGRHFWGIINAPNTISAFKEPKVSHDSRGAELWEDTAAVLSCEKRTCPRAWG